MVQAANHARRTQHRSNPQAPATAPQKPTERQLRQEIKTAATDLLNAASGETKTEKDYARVKLSEDQVVATMVLRRAEKRNLPLADKIKKEFQSYLNQAKGIGAPDPFTAATVALLNDAEKSGTISAKDKEGYMAFALGKAQLDTNEGSINDSATDRIVDNNGTRVANTLDSAVSKIRSNKGISREIASFTMEKVRLDTEFRTLAKAQKEATQATPVTGTPTPVESGKVKDSEEVVAGELPDPSELPTNPTDLVYKPKCMSDGKALIQVPIGFSRNVNSVKIYDRDTDRTYDLTFAGYGKEDGRAHWKLDREGINLGKSVSIILGTISGENEEFRIGDADKYFKYRVG